MKPPKPAHGGGFPDSGLDLTDSMALLIARGLNITERTLLFYFVRFSDSDAGGGDDQDRESLIMCVRAHAHLSIHRRVRMCSSVYMQSVCTSLPSVSSVTAVTGAIDCSTAATSHHQHVMWM